MRIIFCGSRTWVELEAITKIMKRLRTEFGDKLLIIEGGARGADTQSRIAAEYLNVKCLTIRADWDKYGKSAGAIRNRRMLIEGEAQGVVAFSRDLQFSKGTKDMVDFALSKSVPVWVFSDGIEKFFEFIESLKPSLNLFEK